MRSDFSRDKAKSPEIRRFQGFWSCWAVFVYILFPRGRGKRIMVFTSVRTGSCRPHRGLRYTFESAETKRKQPPQRGGCLRGAAGQIRTADLILTNWRYPSTRWLGKAPQGESLDLQTLFPIYVHSEANPHKRE